MYVIQQYAGSFHDEVHRTNCGACEIRLGDICPSGKCKALRVSFGPACANCFFWLLHAFLDKRKGASADKLQVRAAKILPLLDLPDPSKTQSTVENCGRGAQQCYCPHQPVQYVRGGHMDAGGPARVPSAHGGLAGGVAGAPLPHAVQPGVARGTLRPWRQQHGLVPARQLLHVQVGPLSVIHML